MRPCKAAVAPYQFMTVSGSVAPVACIPLLHPLEEKPMLTRRVRSSGSSTAAALALALALALAEDGVD